ncbi:maleylpyruvate isomerase family mycothiol-dependent enzyme [Nocardioides taihuensis]|uniref:Maleylpyruvate isomerase family mycothiol-dependent enzyme n=1 Tax=Nocardioides taihuensis TaxID=1835606 RepID=A0ABW0BPV6_9ACTN
MTDGAVVSTGSTDGAGWTDGAGSTGGSDAARLAGYVEVWWQAVDDFTRLLEELSDEDWHRPTDLPGWDVHDVAAHTAHLEAVLAGAPEETVDVGQPPHVTGLLGLYTEQGVVARKDRTPDELITEIRESATARHTALLADPPTDAGASPPRMFGGVGWSWERLLRNRPLDVWMHDQDVRRAVGRPGGLDGAAAVHVADYLAESLGFVLAKKVGAAPGTTVLLLVHGHAPVAYAVDEAGRGVRLAEAPTEPTATIACDRETFVVLAGGRRRAEDRAVSLRGDVALARQVVDALAVTP